MHFPRVRGSVLDTHTHFMLSCDEHEIPGGGAFEGVTCIGEISEIEF